MSANKMTNFSFFFVIRKTRTRLTKKTVSNKKTDKKQLLQFKFDAELLRRQRSVNDTGRHGSRFVLGQLFRVMAAFTTTVCYAD